jgi:hypothetical protein
MRGEPEPPPVLEMCPGCQGANPPGGPTCRVCKGVGAVEPSGRETEAPGPEVSEFLRAWGLVQRYGPADALVMMGEAGGVWDERFVEAVDVFDAELADLEAAEQWQRNNSRSSSAPSIR